MTKLFIIRHTAFKQGLIAQHFDYRDIIVLRSLSPKQRHGIANLIEQSLAISIGGHDLFQALLTEHYPIFIARLDETIRIEIYTVTMINLSEHLMHD